MFTTLLTGSVFAGDNLKFSFDYDTTQPLNKEVYGANNEFTGTPYNPNSQMYKDLFREVGFCSFRYPAGTPANYINLRTGFAEVWRGTNSNSSNRVLGFNQMIYDSKPDRGVDYLDFIKFMKEVKPTCNFVMNVTSMSVEENRELLSDIKSQGVELTNIEMGNEVYFGAYIGAFPDVDSYLTKVRKYADMARSIFPQVKISLVVHLDYYTKEIFLESTNDSDSRMHQWYEGVKRADFNDAISVHLYSSLGMSDKVTKDKFWSYPKAYLSVISHSDCRTDMTLERVKRDFPNKECWVTEYHVGGFIGELRSYRMRYSYLGALFSTDFMLKLFSHPQVTLSSWHCMNQFLAAPNDIDELMERGIEAFHPLPNIAFLRMLKEPVRESTSFIRCDIKGAKRYTGVGKFKGEFDEVDCGIFYNEETKRGYLIVINKMGRDYTFSTRDLERRLSAKIVAADSVTPDTTTLSLDDALSSESEFMQSILKPHDGGYSISPYSITRIEFHR